MFVAWNMGEWREFVRLRTFRLPYRVILLSVFVLVVVDLTVAVEVGIFFACLSILSLRPNRRNYRNCLTMAT